MTYADGAFSALAITPAALWARPDKLILYVVTLICCAAAAAAARAGYQAARRLRAYRRADVSASAYRFPVLRLRPSLYQPEGRQFVYRVRMAIIGAVLFIWLGLGAFFTSFICAAPHHPC